MSVEYVSKKYVVHFFLSIDEIIWCQLNCSTHALEYVSRSLLIYANEVVIISSRCHRSRRLAGHVRCFMSRNPSILFDKLDINKVDKQKKYIIQMLLKSSLIDYYKWWILSYNASIGTPARLIFLAMPLCSLSARVISATWFVKINIRIREACFISSTIKRSIMTSFKIIRTLRLFSKNMLL